MFSYEKYGFLLMKATFWFSPLLCRRLSILRWKNL